MKPRLFAAGFLFPLFLSCARAQVQITVVEVTYNGKTQQVSKDDFHAQAYDGLQVELKLHGDMISTAKSSEIIVKVATDDLGTDLAKEQFGPDEMPNLSHSLDFYKSVTLKDPAEGAKAIKALSGEEDFYVPRNDPDSTVTVENFQKTAGTPLTSPQLASAGLAITLYTTLQGHPVQASGNGINGGAPGDLTSTAGADTPSAHSRKRKPPRKKKTPAAPVVPFSVSFNISDPHGNFVTAEFEDAKGNQIEDTGSTSMTINGKENKTYNFSAPLPATAKTLIYISTPKANVEVPFSFTDLALP
jgi:hypothetical protein